jgi:glycosyltransferase involved in cell wall biosynthesis
MTTPRVSVIIPAYATTRFIAEALDSVLAQTFDDYEIIVVNDGSPDTAELERVLHPYRDKIHYIVQENRGSSGARNTALRAARGSLVAMLDSDDRWHPDYLASQVAVLDRDPSADVVYPDAVRFDENGLRDERYSQSYPVGGDVTFDRVLARECQIYGEVLARRDALIAVGMYDEVLRAGEDYDLWLRVLGAGKRIVYNDRVLAYYRAREDSHTSDERKMSGNIITLIDRLPSKVTLTAEQLVVLERQRTSVLTKLDLLDAREAFDAGRDRDAIAAVRAAYRRGGGWRLGLAILALRTAPGMVRWLLARRRSWRAGL